MFDSDLDNADNRYAPPESVPEEGSVGVPGKKTKETVNATDAIIDALDTAEEETKRIEQQKVQYEEPLYLCIKISTKREK